MTDIPVVKSPKHVVGNLDFREVELEITGKHDEGVFWGPAMAIHPTMMTGEQRNPIIVTPEMVLPMITQLAHWATRLQSPTETTVASDDDKSGVNGHQVAQEVNPLARIEGETREDWTTRIATINQRSIDQRSINDGTQGKEESGTTEGRLQ